MKFIVKVIRTIRNKYYGFMLDICELGLEEAKLNENEADEKYWTRKFDKYFNKYYVN